MVILCRLVVNQSYSLYMKNRWAKIINGLRFTVALLWEQSNKEQRIDFYMICMLLVLNIFWNVFHSLHYDFVTKAFLLLEYINDTKSSTGVIWHWL